VCAQCHQTEPAYDATIIAADYLPPVDQLVLALKFGHRLSHAALFGELLRDALLSAPPGQSLPTLLLPVPLGRQRLMERGFNQALEIAKPLSHALGVPLHPYTLVRTRETGAQSGLHTGARRSNIRGAFALDLSRAVDVAGQHVGLVDDVMTTGSTLNEVAATLKRYGAARVTNLVFARTPPPEHVAAADPGQVY
jgi:ComF family protein